ncbi:hypothetical protein GTA51_06835 [Desulfovibrio aerotolerans]|uniref:Class I SAM-dependent methyltransferase n=1 Tax=Solidesulfovibrio aerotolerans TaxID=295255 RepID=A0A7C9N179_9BACT|nr:class I SAM-dependent methyltransferase [Solidesulfovibrio aerotolerans]MYL82851.1 hypothetical protein [Solidesulfovibrio aerotolerans]
MKRDEDDSKARQASGSGIFSKLTGDFEKILTNISIVSGYWLITDEFAFIEGFLDPIEGYALYLLSKFGPGIGTIVEIGSYAGRSTAYLARGSKEARREKVIAVDHFEGSPEHREGGDHESAFVKNNNLYDVFIHNLNRAKVSDRVSVIKKSSCAAAADWRHPIRLLFIDGDHSYEDSKRDFECWSEWLVPEGLAVFHDIESFQGVTTFYNELLAGGQYGEVLSVDSLRVVSKIA